MYYLINILLLFEWGAFLASLVFIKQLKKQNGLLIPVTLFVIVFSEAIGKLILNHTVTCIKNNAWFNVMIPVQFLCLFGLFYLHTNYRYWRRVIILFAIVIVILTIADSLQAGSHTFNVLNYTIGSVFLSAVCLHYLYECMNSRAIIAIHTNSLFYLAMGTLLYYLGTLPFHSMRNYLYYNYAGIFAFYNYLSYILNIIMYGLITVGIIWANRK